MNVAFPEQSVPEAGYRIVAPLQSAGADRKNDRSQQIATHGFLFPIPHNRLLHHGSLPLLRSTTCQATTGDYSEPHI